MSAPGGSPGVLQKVSVMIGGRSGVMMRGEVLKALSLQMSHGESVVGYRLDRLSCLRCYWCGCRCCCCSEATAHYVQDRKAAVHPFIS